MYRLQSLNNVESLCKRNSDLFRERMLPCVNSVPGFKSRIVGALKLPLMDGVCVCSRSRGRKIAREAAAGGLESVCLAHVFPTLDITAVFTRLTGSLLNDWSKERDRERWGGGKLYSLTLVLFHSSG